MMASHSSLQFTAGFDVSLRSTIRAEFYKWECVADEGELKCHSPPLMEKINGGISKGFSLDERLLIL
jgi:hypothetical protein